MAYPTKWLLSAALAWTISGLRRGASRKKQILDANSDSYATARVLTPADGKEYVRALSTTNRFCPVRCADEIVQPASTAELAEWLRANQGTPFTLKGGGHSYGCQSVPADGGVMIHTGLLKEAEVFRRSDGSAFLRAGAGLTFDEIIPRLAKMGYSLPHGECLTVGLGGWNMNVGQHPELKNFDNAWGYNGSAFLTKVTFVDYDGTIFTVDRRGIHLVDRGEISWLGWQAKVLKTRTWAAAIDVGTTIGGEIDVVAVSNTMRLFKIFGASLAIATEFEFELLPKPEPGFFQVTYSVGDVLDDAGGKGRQLMQAIFDVVANGADPEYDCGIFYASDFFEGTQEGAIFLKCADWASPTGATIERVAPPGYVSFKPKASGFLFWAKDSYGKGWVPTWHAEELDRFQQIGGAELFREHLRALVRGDASGPNPCDACSSELMYMTKPLAKEHVMFDNLCTARRSNQDACSAFVLRIKEAFLGDRPIVYKQNLPSCARNPDWGDEIAEYRRGANAIAKALKSDWDPRGVVDFWLGAGHDNAAPCDAISTQEVGAACQRHGITPDDLVEAEHAYVGAKCPAWASYDNFDHQNGRCTEYIYSTSEPVPVTDI